MPRYVPTEADRCFAKEFRDAPIGYHSPGLQRILNLFRGTATTGKYVLLVREPYRRWGLGWLPPARGASVEVIEGVEFTDLRQAEWEVFKRRWRDFTGQDLDPEAC